MVSERLKLLAGSPEMVPKENDFSVLGGPSSCKVGLELPRDVVQIGVLGKTGDNGRGLVVSPLLNSNRENGFLPIELLRYFP